MGTFLQLALLFAGFTTMNGGSQSAAPPPAPSRADAIPQARVTGHVDLADTHKPARNAVVLLTSLDGQNRQFQRVGFDGAYLFEHVVPGEYIIITYLDGYLSPFDEVNVTPADTTIAQLFAKIVAVQGALKVGAQGTQTVDISLKRGASVSGRVLYSDGSPAIQADIELQDVTAEGSTPGQPSIDLGDIARSEFVHQPFETDDQGRFRITGVRPGTYRIAAVQPEKENTQMPDSVVRAFGGALRYYDKDTIHPRLAKAHTLVAGQELRDLEIRIPLDGFHSVQGEVVTRDGRKITSDEVTATDTADAAVWLTAFVHDGSFRFDRLPPGTYKLTAQYGNLAPAAGAPIESFGGGEATFVVKDADVNSVTLTLPPASKPN